MSKVIFPSFAIIEGPNLMLTYMIYAISFPHTNSSTVHTRLNSYYHGKTRISFTVGAIHIDKQSYVFLRYEFDPQ